jgi:hypothetical protein
MNHDDLERRIQRQRWRPLPYEWRAQILQAARGSSTLERSRPAPRRFSPAVRPLAWWRQLLWPSPRAWAGLAATWGFIFVLQLSSHSPSEHTVKPWPALSPQVALLLDEQRRLVTELLDLNPPGATAEPPPAAPPRPRSQRRNSSAIA